MHARERRKTRDIPEKLWKKAADAASLADVRSGPGWQILLRGQLAVQRRPDCLTAGDCHLAEFPCWGVVSTSSTQKVRLPETGRQSSVSNWIGSSDELQAVYRSPPVTNASRFRKILWPVLLGGPLATCINVQGGNLMHFSTLKLERMW